MTQEEISLLLRDLCARLPYGVICQVDDGAAGLNDGKLVEIDISKELVRFDADYHWDAYIDDVKPYLRSMSSMTEKEDDEWCGLNIDPLLEAVGKRHTRVEDSMLRAKSQYQPTEWLIAHHFDYHGLIPMGLAIEVTPENNPYKDVKD
jgi:hypothetical protein